MRTNRPPIADSGRGLFGCFGLLSFNVARVSCRRFHKELEKRSYLSAIVLVLLVLWSHKSAAAAQPVLVRDAFSSRQWHLFIPADDVNEYWARYDFVSPFQSDSYTSYFTLGKILYGKVRPGAVFTNGIGGYSEPNGTWISDSNLGWNYRSAYYAGNSIRTVIPAGYNVIQVLTYNVNDSGNTLRVEWSDNTTTGLDVTSINISSGTGPTCTTVATNANPDGVKSLQLVLINNGVIARVIGVRAYNSTAIGVPSTTSGGLATGHDIITTYCISPGCWSALTTADSSVWDMTASAATALEFAIKWGRYDYDWAYRLTGGHLHFDRSMPLNGPYTYHSGEYASGPVITVNGVDANSIWDDTNNPRRKLKTGRSIAITSTGFADWDKDATEDAFEPNLTWVFVATKSNLNVSVSTMFKDNSFVDAYSYGPMWWPADINIVSIQLPPNRELLAIPSDHTLWPGSQYTIYYDNIPAKVTVDGSNTYTFYYANPKFYEIIDVAAQPGGTNPQSNTIWSFGGSWTIERQWLEADLDFSGSVDLFDFAIFADQWCEDSNSP